MITKVFTEEEMRKIIKILEESPKKIYTFGDNSMFILSDEQTVVFVDSDNEPYIQELDNETT